MARQVAPPQVRRGGIKGGSFLLSLILKPSFLHAGDLTRPGPRARRSFENLVLIVKIRVLLAVLMFKNRVLLFENLVLNVENLVLKCENRVLILKISS